MQCRVSWKRALFGLLLGVATVTLILILARRASSMRLAEVCETLLLPGALLAFVVSPGGVHGPLPYLWVPAIRIGSLIFYSALWYLVLTLASKGRRSGGHVASKS